MWCTSGIVGTVCIFPIDMVKTRLQNQKIGADGQRIYKGALNCFQQIVSKEGTQICNTEFISLLIIYLYFLCSSLRSSHSLLPAKGFRGLYRGLGANLIGVTPEKAIKVCPPQLQLLFPRNMICYCAKLTCDGVNLCQLAVNERLREAFEKPDGSIALHHEVRSTARHLVITISVFILFHVVAYLLMSNFSEVAGRSWKTKRSMGGGVQILAGGGAGLCQVIATNPMEISNCHNPFQLFSAMITIMLILFFSVPKRRSECRCRAPSPLRCARAPLYVLVFWLNREGTFLTHVPSQIQQVVKEMGLRGVYKGTPVTLLRDVPFSFVFFPAYANLKTNFSNPDVYTNPTHTKYNSFMFVVSAVAWLTKKISPHTGQHRHSAVVRGRRTGWCYCSRHSYAGWCDQDTCSSSKFQVHAPLALV